ncbi:MAG: ComEA family DNA-binding protein [Clostridia bacterium]|jgi:competence protein ComEA|nr:ComEA family DNA-binding protein [Clostridia bacterium]
MIDLSKKQILILIIIGSLMVGIIGYYIYTKLIDNKYEEIDILNTTQNNILLNKKNDEETQEIVVHIAGEVKKEGIVRTKEGVRIADIIEAAEGLTQEADITNINLAYIVEDGQKIIIPSKVDKEEIKQEYITQESGSNLNKESIKTEAIVMININKASITELEQLPGIGGATAQKIIDYRKENGKFNQIEDIKKVQGIGEAKYEAIKDNICVK